MKGKGNKKNCKTYLGNVFRCDRYELLQLIIEGKVHYHHFDIGKGNIMPSLRV